MKTKTDPFSAFLKQVSDMSIAREAADSTAFTKSASDAYDKLLEVLEDAQPYPKQKRRFIVNVTESSKHEITLSMTFVPGVSPKDSSPLATVASRIMSSITKLKSEEENIEEEDL